MIYGASRWPQRKLDADGERWTQAERLLSHIRKRVEKRRAAPGGDRRGKKKGKTESEKRIVRANIDLWFAGEQ